MLKNLCQSMDDKMVQRGKKVREEKIKQREQEKIENEKLLESNVNDKGSVINPKESNINDKLNEPQEHSNNFKQNHLCDIDVNSSITDGTQKNSCSGEIVSISTIENKNDTKSNDPILTSRESSPNVSKNEMVHNIHQSDSSEMSVKPKISELSNEECEPGEVVSETENSVAIIQSCKSNHEHSHKHIHKKRHKRTKKFEYDTSSSDSSDSDSNSSSSSSSSSSSHSDEEEDIQAKRMKELERRKNHPDRLHEELWFNDPGEMNDGPLCRCSLKAQRSGIRHGFYLGEKKLEPCDPWSNNADRLHHYLVTISPPTNFLVKTPTVISHIGNEFIFEGFSLLSHHPLKEVPTCSVIRFNIEYTILYIEEKIPDNFCIRELDLFYDYLFLELLELVDLNLNTMGDTGGCPRFHFMPRFVRNLPDNGKEILSMNEVLMHILRNSGPLIPEEELAHLLKLSQYQWQNYADNLKGMVVTCPGMKPCSIRVDQLDRDQDNDQVINYPVIVHFGIRPPQLSYAGNPVYQKAWREYVKFRHLLANMPKPSPEDKCKLANKESQLQEMRMTSKMKRDVTVAVSSHGFYRTGIMCDVVQHAMLLPVLVCHLRFHQSLDLLTKRIGYKFHNRYLLQLALTHPSYRENFGTNPDHARNSLTNCSIRQPEYGDRRIHYMHTRKRGINTLINIMSRFGARQETESKITHNERLEFLGDAVVEFLSSIHLFHLFPNLEEGGLATYRAAIVQNQHLAVLAEKLGLDEFMLYAHGSDLCHDFELRHAMANCFEALMGAIFLDAGIEEADKVFSATLFLGEELEHDIWVNYPPHPLQEQEPNGDRKWMEHFPILKKLANYEGSIGVEFRHIRLLARVFTDRSIGPNNLTLGSNQRLEFLGDTVLQLVASEYLYKFFPEHHEGHLSLLRSSLVNNRTQAVVCDDLDMTKYAIYSELKSELKTKDRADLLEAFLGALYIDRGLDYCKVFCEVCFFPRLHQFIMNQDWNDPKSKLQQCCLTLRTMDGGEPDIPIYKVIECKGPTNTRVYTVAVYFRNKRLAKASGHSIQTAEMNAAKEALSNSKDLFPQLDHQRRVIEKSVKIQVGAHAHSLHADTQNNNDLKRREQDKDREKIKEKVRREGDISERAEHFREEEKRKRGSSKPKISEIRSDIVRDSRNRMRNNDKIEGEENRNRHSKFKNSKTSEPTSDINRDNIMRDNDNDSDISKREEYILDESRRNIHSNSKYSETRNNIQSDSGNRMMENDKSDSDLSERAEYTQEEKNKKHKSTCKYSKTRSEIHGESRNTMRDNNKSDRYGSGNEKLKQNSRYIGDSKYRKEICANGTLRKDSKLKSNENSRFRNTDTRRDNYLNAERSKDSSKYNDKSNIPFLHKEKSSYVKKQTRDSSKPKLYLWSGKDDNEKDNNYSDGKNLKTQRYSDFT
ncbi:unnamed protein product [Meganyctiphanes norvegica]|uniref:Ribonuclease 3 n=1 Tax=Meganyctiphanes norvegica TaxID=48144 RepID=A0AAV2QSV2_MEGNR